MRTRVETCSTCGANLTDCCRQCLVCVEAGRAERVPCAPNIEAAEAKAIERQRAVAEELAALRKEHSNQATEETK